MSPLQGKVFDSEDIEDEGEEDDYTDRVLDEVNQPEAQEIIDDLYKWYTEMHNEFGLKKPTVPTVESARIYLIKLQCRYE